MSKVEIVNEEVINLVEFKCLTLGDYFIFNNILYIKCIKSTSDEFSMGFNAISLGTGCLGCFKDDIKVRVVNVKIMYD